MLTRHDTRSRSRLDARLAPIVGAGLAIAVFLTGCGNKSEADKPASQTAAKVNKNEITVHQINFVLQQQRGLPPDQAASAGRQVLERLIDQELAIQKAQDQKLDRDPLVVQQIEAARRDIVARAYADRISAGAPKPAPAEIKGYFDSHPALFSQRRVYSLQEVTVQAKPDQLAALQARVAASKDVAEFVDYLKANDLKFLANQEVRAAEQLRLDLVDRFAKLKDGQAIFARTPNGARIVYVVGTRDQPVQESQVTPAIEQFLWNERKRKVVADDVKAMRTSAKIEYVGDYAKGAAVQAPTEAASDPPPLTSLAPPLPTGSMPSAARQVEVEPVNSAPASAPALGTLEKGLQGFK